MILSSGSGKLNFALKTLRARWDQAKLDWNDHVRQEFEDKHYTEIEYATAATLTAISRLAQVLATAQQECS